MLRVNRVHHPVTALGPGRRLGLWLQGCPLACPGCMSRDTWSPEGGQDVSLETLLGLWQTAVEDGAHGLTISGGEPLAQATELARLLEAAREVQGDHEADFLLYTGFDPDELDEAQRAVVARADAVVTGRYRAGEPTDLLWRGSANQQLRLISPLGEARYSEFVEARAERAPLQVAADGRRLFVIGVPPPGALPRLERALRQEGITFEEAAWRP